MNTAPTGLDSLAAVLIVIIVLISLLTLLGMASLMAISAMSSKRPLVTSWPNDQEQAFVPFEHRGAVSNTRAWAYSLIGATVLTVFAAGVYFGVTPEKKDFAKDMNMSNLTKKKTPAAPKPDPAKSDSAAPAEAPNADPAAPSAPQQ